VTAYPPSDALLDAVVRYLREDVLPQSEGASKFNMRVTINLLELVGREYRLQEAAEARELARLRALLGDGGIESLRVALCDAVASGALDCASAELTEHLRLTAIDRLAIDQPRYSAYRRTAEKIAAAAGQPGSKP